jgi:hypothetical protein
LYVPSFYYANYSPVVEIPVTRQQQGATITENITLPCANYVSGKVVNTCGDWVAAYVWYECDWYGSNYKVNPAWVKANGDFSMRIPFNTTGTFWIEDYSGNTFSQTITTTFQNGENIDLGEVEICEANRPSSNLITITYSNGDTLDIPVNVNGDSIFARLGRRLPEYYITPYGDTSYYEFLSSNNLTMGELYRFFATSKSQHIRLYSPYYDEESPTSPTTIEYNNSVYFYISTGTEYLSGRVSVSITVQSSNRYTVSITGSLTYYDNATKTSKEVTISGTFDVFARDNLWV